MTPPLSSDINHRQLYLSQFENYSQNDTVTHLEEILNSNSIIMLFNFAFISTVCSSLSQIYPIIPQQKSDFYIQFHIRLGCKSILKHIWAQLSFYSFRSNLPTLEVGFQNLSITDQYFSYNSLSK